MAAMSLLLAAALLSAEVPVTMERLPDTGQTRRFAAGDDSTYTIHPPKLARNGDGTVLDEVTGLLWQQGDGGEMKWESAAGYCAALSLAGLDGWRVPSNRELFSIMNHNNAPPAIDNAVFERSPAEYWWSAELLAADPSRAWAVNAGGGSGPHPQAETISAGGSKRFHVRCVRGGILRQIEESFTSNGDGTVTDNRTGLLWHDTDADSLMSWEDALQFALTAEIAGFTDWRLPNVKELQSIHDETAVRPAIDARYFPSARAALYWTSTTLINREGDRAWTVDFNLGIVSYNPKVERLRVRLVRGNTEDQ